MIGVALAILFAGLVVRDRRPTGSTAAWLLAIVLIPWVGVPLYLVFGGRKLRRAREKPALVTPQPSTDAPPDDSVERVLQATGAGITRAGNRVDWHADGEAAFAALCAAIDGAQHTIRIETFVLGDDDVADALIAKLGARAAAGVSVHMLLDGLLVTRGRRKAIRALEPHGGKVAVFEPLLRPFSRGRTNLRNHRKIMVFDGELALIGGRNLAHEYMGPTPSPDRWEDVSWTMRGPGVMRADQVFCADWEFATGETLAPCAPPEAAGDVALSLVPSGPDASTDPIYESLLQSIFMARARVWIATPYFTPDPALERSLALAARRGCDVRVIVPAHSNHRVADLVGRSYLVALADVGIKVLRFPRMLHAKVVLADDWLVCGSANFDMRSLFLDYECSMVTSSATEVAWIASWYQRMAAQCSTEPMRRSTLSDLARLVAPLV